MYKITITNITEENIAIPMLDTSGDSQTAKVNDIIIAPDKSNIIAFPDSDPFGVRDYYTNICNSNSGLVMEISEVSLPEYSREEEDYIEDDSEETII